ncbi:DUF3540 domain-containing protein [Marinicellulosiphila megalodicopiae]|uniref:DUF3540 domain-containing protein n=1 Tax=Marinicellulosiphila megalodicopiae TaxID=2724896 RepID=UPI003BAE659B
MLNLLESQNSSVQYSFTKQAKVTRVDDQKIWVRLEHAQASFVVECLCAMLQTYQPSVGDTVLVNGDNFKLCYIIGVIDAVTKNEATIHPNKINEIKNTNGAVAKSYTKEGSECLAVEDENGFLLFEYDSVKKQSKIFSPKGDLTFSALEGGINLYSAEHIKCHSIGAIDLQSSTAAQLRVANHEKQTAINLSNEAMSISTNQLALEANQAQVNVDHSHLVGKTLNTVLDHSKLMVTKLETHAGRILENAKNIYRNIEQLSQTKAKRMRTMVEKDYQLKSESSTIHAKKNINIDGEKINLG